MKAPVMGLTAMVVLTALAATYAPAEPPGRPQADEATVLLWHLDENEGTVAHDASPGGTLSGEISGAEWVEGRFGTALQWGEDNGQVRVSGDFSALREAFTLQAWIYLEQMPTGVPPFWGADVAGRLGSFTLIVRPPGRLYAGVVLGEQTNYIHGVREIPLQQWTHVALVYDGPARKIGLFVNGEPDVEFDVAPGSPPAPANPDTSFFIRSYGGGDEKLVGRIDEVMLSARAETFGNSWTPQIYLHNLRYRGALLVGIHSQVGLEDSTGLHLQLRDADGTVAHDHTVTVDEAMQGAEIPAADLAEGEYVAVVSSMEPDGTRVELMRRELVHTPPQRQLADITPDNIYLLDGEPFFPLGAYHVRIEDLPTLREGGFNLVYASPTDWPHREGDPDYIAVAQEQGLHSIGRDGGPYDHAYYRDKPGVVFWYVADEPHGPGREPHDMWQRYNDWGRKDPTHPMFLLHNVPSMFLAYAPACDIFATDPYPVRRGDDPPLIRVADFTRSAVSAVFDKKPVWVALQAYTVRAVSEAGRSMDGVPRLPTYDETRCMSYMALAAGARGLLYYAFDDTYFDNGIIRGVHLAREYPEFWSELTRVVQEIGTHSDLWTTPYADLPVENETPVVVVQERPYETTEGPVLLVVNSAKTAQSLRVRADWAASGEAADLLGGTPGQVRDGVLADELEPYAAKAYRLAVRENR